MEDNNLFGRNQLLALSSLILLSPVLRLLPGSAAAAAGRPAYLAALTALPFMLGYARLTVKLTELRREGEGLSELTLRLLGGRAGKIALISEVLWLILYSAFILRSGADRFISTIYPSSSPYIFVVFTTLVCTAGALCSCRALVRLAKIILPFIWGFIVLILITALFGVKKENLLPVSSSDFLPLIKSSLWAVNVLTAVIFLSLFFLSDVKKEAPSFRELGAWLVAMSVFIVLLSAAISGSFGTELTVKLTWPFFSLIRNLVLLGTLERFEALVVAIWIFPDFLLVSMLLHSAQHSLRLALGVSPPAGKREKFFYMGDKRWIIPLCSVFSMLIALFMAPDPLLLELWSKRIIPIINLSFTLIFFPLLYIIGKRRS